MKATLSQTFAERLKPTSKNTYYWDTSIVGFGLKISTSGLRSWFVQRTVPGSASKPRLVLGSFPAMDFNTARQQALLMIAQVEGGTNPKVAKIKDSIKATTVEDVMEMYSQKPMNENTRKNLRLFLDKHLYPKYKTWTIEEFTRGTLIKWMEDDYSSLPGVAFNLVGYIHAAWNYALIREIIPPTTPNPAFRVKKSLEDSGFKFRRSENGYKMALEVDDLTKLIGAIKDSYTDDSINAIAVAATEMILNTGARRNEIQTLRFDEIDYDKRLITKREPGKNKLPRYIRLSDSAIAVLDKASEVRVRKGRENGIYVFPSGREGHKNKHITSINAYLKLIGAKAGIPDLKPHNLRSLYINIAIDAGVPVPVVAENVGHTNVMTTMLHYLKNKPSNLFAGINTVGELLSSLTMDD